MKRTLIAFAAFLLCVAATQWAMRGRHEPTGNAGYLGTELAGVEGIVSGTSYGVRGVAPSGTGVFGQSSIIGVHGLAFDAVDSNSCGVYGLGPIGVRGDSEDGFGVEGLASTGTGVYGFLTSGGTGHAGYFEGRVHVNGTLSKSAGSFKIDHPLDPAGKYLQHSFVESPDMKNIYDGVVTLGDDGSAVVELPEWFDALNKDFRYQLTCIGEPAVVYIAEKIKDNRFRIAGGYAGMEVSWQVTGTRDDEYARAYPIAVEEIKAPREIGKFLHPELYRQPLTSRIEPKGGIAR